MCTASRAQITSSKKKQGAPFKANSRKVVENITYFKWKLLPTIIVLVLSVQLFFLMVLFFLYVHLVDCSAEN